MEVEKEDDILKIRTSRKLYIPFYFMVFVLISVIIFVKIYRKPLNDMALNLVLIFAIAVIIATEIHRLGNSYEINKNSVIHRKGYFKIVSKRIEYGAISDIDIEQNPWQRIFSFGNIQIFKFSEKSIIRNINKPDHFVNFLAKKMRGVRGRIR